MHLRADLFSYNAELVPSNWRIITLNKFPTLNKTSIYIFIHFGILVFRTKYTIAGNVAENVRFSIMYIQISNVCIDVQSQNLFIYLFYVV